MLWDVAQDIGDIPIAASSMWDLQPDYTRFLAGAQDLLARLARIAYQHRAPSWARPGVPYPEGETL